MKNDNSVSWRVAQLSSRLDQTVVTSLWILRAASPDYQPAYEQLGILDMLDSSPEECTAETPWHAVTAASRGTRLSAMAQALRPILPDSPFPDALTRLAPLSADGENALDDLVGLLSSLSPESAAFARLYPGSAAFSVSGKNAFSIPSGILRLLLSCMELENGGSLYDPACGTLLPQTMELLPQTQALRFYAQAQEPGSYQLGHVSAYLQGIHLELGEKATDTLREDLFPAQKFDCILCNPPFNQSKWYEGGEALYDPRWRYGIPPRSNGNFAWLQHVVSHLSGRGRAAVILPNGTLTTQVQAERDIRAELLKAGLVEAILALPAGIFAATRIPCCLWLLAAPSRATSTTLFIDAQMRSLTGEESEDILLLTGLIHQHRRGLLKNRTTWYAAASLEEIVGKDFLLSPNFYTLTLPLSPEPMRRNFPQLPALIAALEPQLRDSGLYPLLAQWKALSPAKAWHSAAIDQLYHISGGIVKKKASFGHGTPMVDVAAVIRSPFLPAELPSLVETAPDEMEKYRVRRGDIFMNRSSENTDELACCCVAAEDREAVFGGYLKRLRPRNSTCPNPLYMAAYFRSAVYRQEILRVSPVFTTRSNINMARLSKVRVYYPDAAMQETLGQTMLALFRFQETCFDQALAAQLERLTQLLIEQLITYPILCMLEKNPGSA